MININENYNLGNDTIFESMNIIQKNIYRGEYSCMIRKSNSNNSSNSQINKKTQGFNKAKNNTIIRADTLIFKEEELPLFIKKDSNGNFCLKHSVKEN